MGKSYFEPISEKEYFRLNNGETLKSLEELYGAIKKMSDSVFSYHVNSEKNDFSAWVKDVFKDKALASRLAKAKTKDDMLNCLKTSFAEKKMDEILANILAIENAKKISSGLYPRTRIINYLRRAYEDV